MEIRSKVALALAAIAAIVLVAFSCSNEGNGFLSRLFRGGGGSAVPVTVESVSVTESATELNVPARLDASEKTDITLPYDVVVDRAMVTEGAVINAGDPILKISEEEQSSELAKKRASLKEARANLEKNTYFLRNRDRLLEEGRIDRNQYDNLESEVEASEGAAEKLQAEVSKMEERAPNSIVASPAGGIVTNLMAPVGVTIPAGKPLAQITRTDPIVAAFRLASYEAGTVKTGMTVEIKLPELGGEAILARITSVDTTIDPKDDTFGVKASAPNPTGYLKAGMQAGVQFVSSKKQRFFLVPEEALIKERQRYYVFTVIKGVAHKVQVVPNESRGDRIEIVKGLRDDDLVVVKGHNKLTEGTVVDIWGR